MVLAIFLYLDFGYYQLIFTVCLETCGDKKCQKKEKNE